MVRAEQLAGMGDRHESFKTDVAVTQIETHITKAKKKSRKDETNTHGMDVVTPVEMKAEKQNLLHSDSRL